MACLELKIRAGCQEPYVEFFVDGIDLGARVRESFGTAGYDEVLPYHGVDYSLSETVLGEEVRSHGAKSAIILACGCGCGCSACSSVRVNVALSEKTITFSNFSTWSQGKPVESNLGAVVFDRMQFEEAISGLQAMIEAWQPPTIKVPPQPPPIALPPR